MTDNKFGVINEQGYPAGQLGPTPINESDKKNIDDSDKEDSKEKKEKENNTYGRRN